MRYTLQEQPDGSHMKYRHSELSEHNGGRPTNAELEFWLEIESLRDKIIEMGEGMAAMKEGVGIRIANLEAEIKRLIKENHKCQHSSR